MNVKRRAPRDPNSRSPDLALALRAPAGREEISPGSGGTPAPRERRALRVPPGRDENSPPLQRRGTVRSGVSPEGTTEPSAWSAARPPHGPLASSPRRSVVQQPEARAPGKQPHSLGSPARAAWSRTQIAPAPRESKDRLVAPFCRAVLSRHLVAPSCRAIAQRRRKRSEGGSAAKAEAQRRRRSSTAPSRLPQEAWNPAVGIARAINFRVVQGPRGHYKSLPFWAVLE